MNRVWAAAAAVVLLVAVGCASAPPTPAPARPTGPAVIAGANAPAGAFADRPALCLDLAATAMGAVSVPSVIVRDVWLHPPPLCYLSIVSLFDPTAPAPGVTPPLGGEWVGS